MKHASPKFRIQRTLVLSVICLVAVAGLLALAASAKRTRQAASVSASMASPPPANYVPETALSNAQGKKPLAPQAAVIVATLTDNVTAATKIAPGGTINYTVTITNNGAASPADDAANLNYSAPLDANTTLVGGSIHASPIARNDTYNWVGNTQLDTAARALPAIISNDVAVNAPGGTDTFAVTAIAGGPTALGGTVSVASPSGAFTYTPPVGRPNIADGASVNDTFTYTITNSADPSLTSTGTVTITLTGRVWYLQAGAAGDGRSNTPSSSPAAMSTAADKSTDVFYIFSNAGSLNGAFSVDAGQQLLGQGVNLVVSSITLFTAAAPTPTTTNTAGSCVSLVGAPGNNTLSGFNIGNCTGGTAITGANVGTLNVSTMTINTNGGALDLTGVGLPTVSVVLGGLTSTGGAKNVNLVSLNGTFTLAFGALSGAAGNAFDVNGGNAGITYSGGISNSGGRQVSIINKTSGTVDLSGAVNGTGTGIFLNANGTSAINFTGGVVLSTSTNDAFTATSSGTITVTGAGNTLTTTSGQALKVVSTTIAATGLTFRSITSGTGAGSAGNGITLDTTGALGGLTVTGNGSAGTGGTIQHKTGVDANFATQGTGIYLNSTSNAQFNWMQLNDFSNFAIRGNNVTGFRFDNSVINGISGDVVGAPDEAAIRFGGTIDTDPGTGLVGSASISNSNISGGFEYVIKILNNSGTLDRLLVNNTTIGANHDAASGNGGDAFQVVTNNSATANLTVTNSTFTSAGADPFDVIAHEQSNMDVVFKNNNVSNSHVNQAGAASNVLVFSTSTGNCTYDVSNNTVVADTVSAIHNTSNGIAVAKGIPDTGTGGTMSGTVNGNTIGISGVVNSGSAFTGIFASALGTGTHTTAITNNTIFHYNEEGIFLKSNDPLGGGTAVLNATVTGNITTQPDSLAFAGIWVLAGSGSGTENHTIHLVLGDISAAAVAGSPTGSLQNDFTNGDPANASDVEIQELGSNSTLNLSKAGSASGTVATIVQDDNVGTPVVDSFGTAINLVTAQTVRLIAPAPISVLEDGANNITYTFLRYGDTSSALTVNFTVGGAAVFGTDYTQSGAATFTTTTGTVTFPAASDLVKVTIDPTVDGSGESDETVILTLAAGAGYTVASPSAATTTIRNDDPVSPIARLDLRHIGPVAATENVLAQFRPLPTLDDFKTESVHPQDTVTEKPLVSVVATRNTNYRAAIGNAMHHAVNTIAGFAHTVDSVITPTAYAQDSVPNAPTSGETVTLNTIATFPAGGKSITIKYSATVNTPPLARQVSTQGMVTANGGAISVLTDDPEPAGGPQATVTLVDTLMTWNGSTSTDWNTASNWTQPAGGTQYAPGVSNPAVNDVVIPNVGNQPNISATDITVFSLNISNGRTLTITSPRVLTIGGSPGGDLTLDGIISGGNLNLGTGTHVINNAGGTGSLSSTNVATVLSGGTVTLNNNLQAGALGVNAGGSMNITNRTLSLNGSGAALVIPGGATFTTTGSAVVFNGTAAQTAAGIAYNNLTINNSIGLNVTGVTLTGNATVNGALALTSSDLDTGAFTLTQPNTTASTGVSDVVGTVSRTGGPFALATPLTFGNPNNILTVTAGATRPTSVTFGIAKAAPANPNGYAAAVLRTYTISQTGSAGSTYQLRLHYLDPGELNGNVEANLNLRRLRTSDNHWTVHLPTTVNAASDYVESTGVLDSELQTRWTMSSLAPTASNAVVTGRITDAQGRPVEGAVVRLSGAQERKFITDANGNYRFDNVETGEFYTVTPTRVNYHFNPFNRSFSQSGNQTEAVFTAESMGDGANPLDTAEYFVRQQYVDVLGREPEEAGFNYWSDKILGCGDDVQCVNTQRREVAAAFFIAEENQASGVFIYDAYAGALGRRPAFAEFSVDRTHVVGGATLDADKTAFAQSFVQRAEFLTKYQNASSADAFVDALLQSVRGTGADLSSERASLIEIYGQGADQISSRAAVLRSIADNATFKQSQYNPAFVLTEYFAYLRRDAEPEGFNFWVGVLTTGDVGNYRGMVCSFVTSREYQNRFSQIVSHSNGECSGQ